MPLEFVGQSSQFGLQGLQFRLPAALAEVESVLRAGNVRALVGQAVRVPIELLAARGENTLGFSVAFDPTGLVYQSATLGGGLATGSALILNTNQTTVGRLGVLLARPPGEAFLAGTQQVLTVEFQPAPRTVGTNTLIEFADQPIRREMVSADVQVLPANYLTGTVELLATLPSIIFQSDQSYLVAWFMEGHKLDSSSSLQPDNLGDIAWRIAAAGDFNGDRQPDLLLQHTDGTLGVWFMEGVTLKSAAYLNPAKPRSAGWVAVDAADFDRDGKLDLLLQHAEGTLAIWYLDGVRLVSAEYVNPPQPSDRGWRAVQSLWVTNGRKATGISPELLPILTRSPPFSSPMPGNIV